MNYADTRNSAYAARFSPDFRLPPMLNSVVKRGLATQVELRDIDTAAILAEVLGDDTSAEHPDVQLAGARLLSSISLKLSLTDFLNTDPQRFTAQSEDTKTEIVSEAVQNFGRQAGMEIDRLDGDLHLLPLLHELYPLQAIPHQFVRQQIHGYKRRQTTLSQQARTALAYANVVPGSYRSESSVGSSVGINDSLLVQAFGRNGFPDKQLPEVVDFHRRHGDRQTFEWLLAQGFDEGASNRALADEVARALGESLVLEPVLQWEVAYSLYKNYPSLYASHENYLHTVWPRSDFYPTFEVKADSIRTMDEVGLYNPQELAHPDMLVRALGILARQGMQADARYVDVSFDPASVQMQARGPLRWVVRESLTRAEHLVRDRVRF